MVRFLIHPNARTHLELMLYEFPKGDQEIHFHKTNDVGGIRHVALEVTDAVVQIFMGMIPCIHRSSGMI